MTQTTGSKLVTPYMRVSFNGRTHKVQVKPGVEGAKEFEYEIRRLLQLPDDQEFDVIFHCRAPGTGTCVMCTPVIDNACKMQCLQTTAGQYFCLDCIARYCEVVLWVCASWRAV